MKKMKKSLWKEFLKRTNREDNMTKKNKWDKLETKIWRVVLFKEDKKGNQKFYEYDGDHSSIAEQMYDVENEYLNEIEENEK